MWFWFSLIAHFPQYSTHAVVSSVSSPSPKIKTKQQMAQIAHTRTNRILSSLNIVPWMVGITAFEVFLCSACCIHLQPPSDCSQLTQISYRYRSPPGNTGLGWWKGNMWSTLERTIMKGISQSDLTLRLLMSNIYGAPILDVSRSHTTTQHSR